MGDFAKSCLAILAFVVTGIAGALILDWIALTFKRMLEEETAARINIAGGGETQTGSGPVTHIQTKQIQTNAHSTDPANCAGRAAK